MHVAQIADVPEISVEDERTTVQQSICIIRKITDFTGLGNKTTVKNKFRTFQNGWISVEILVYCL